MTIHYRGESMKTAPFNVNNIFLDSLLTFYKKRSNNLNILNLILIRPLIKFAFVLKKITFYNDTTFPAGKGFIFFQTKE